MWSEYVQAQNALVLAKWQLKALMGMDLEQEMIARSVDRFSINPFC
jgi:hypothetical protein